MAEGASRYAIGLGRSPRENHHCADACQRTGLNYALGYVSGGANTLFHTGSYFAAIGIPKSPRMSRHTQWIWLAGLPSEPGCVLTNSIKNVVPCTR